MHLKIFAKMCIILFTINNSRKWNLPLIGKWRKSNCVYLYERLKHSVGDNISSCYNIDRRDLRPRNDHMGWSHVSVVQFLVHAILFPGPTSCYSYLPGIPVPGVHIPFSGLCGHMYADTHIDREISLNK